MADTYSTKPAKPTTIYTLSDPKTGEVRYVGKTVNSLARRLSNHLRDTRLNHRYCWIKSVLNRGLKPIINAIEKNIGDNWVERERYWIGFYNSQGAHLVNHSDGGEGASGVKHSPEHCAKMRALWENPEYRLKVISANKGRKASPEARANMREGQKRRLPPTAETRDKISAAGKGRKFSPETIRKISDANRRRKLSAETRAKMSTAAKARYSRISKNRLPPNQLSFDFIHKT